MPIERGIAKLLDVPIVEMRAGRGLAAIYSQLADDIVETVRSVDVVLSHVKGPDEAGHDGDVDSKVTALELVDKHLIGRVVEKLDLARVVVCVTNDHATPCHLTVHSDDKVPIALAGGDLAADKVAAFDEASCTEGELPLTRGRELVPYIVSEILTN
jgi:2,3-bisphosphoglycerate-independent phosphoglycerate mutase